ncbi:MAG: TrbC/VirB2 family protein [Rickettsiales bacterium]|jgi:type IV secretory pathway VirB2 component (pilin)|nr:TrbC/VirB2 family protein [Rickettsiales bacterium]
MRIKTRTQAIALIADDAHTQLMIHRVFLVAAILYLIYVTIAFAGGCPSAGNNTPMGQVLCTVVNFMYGNLGRGLATLAVITLGVGALLGKVSWGMAVTVGIGIAVMFNAEAITGMMLGCGSSANFCP